VFFMSTKDVDRWLQSYVEAWKTYDRDKITTLFAEDVEYRYHPYDDPIKGRDAVVASWLGESSEPGASTRDPEGTYDATYNAIAVDGDVAVATGKSVYMTEPGGEIDKVFHNCFVMRFDDQGRCREFTEWFMEERP
jgi:ketosteroid isomerase-like protein